MDQNTLVPEFRHLSLSDIDPLPSLCDPLVVCGADSMGDALQPILVLRAGDTRVTIIDGYKRFLRAQNRKQSSILCGIIPNDPNIESAQLRIELNKGRSLQIREKLLWVRWVCNRAPDERSRMQLGQEIAGLDSGTIKLYSQIVQAPPALIALVALGLLDPQAAVNYINFPPEDLATFSHLLGSLSLSLQHQREFGEWLLDCAFRHQCTITEILSRKEIVDILGHTSLNVPQKVERLRQHFFDLRFPLLAAAKQNWAHAEKLANPNTRKVHFIPSPSFEKNRLEVRITVESAVGAQKVCADLANINQSLWEKLICPNF